MPSISNTTNQHTFHRRDPKDVHNHAIFEFSSDPSRPRITKITLPEKSTWSPGLHWHEQHIEYFKVINGRVKLTRNGVTKIVTSDDGLQRVERFVVHDFCRVDKDSSEKDSGDVITEEWTDPADGIKHVFFRNIFSTLQDAEEYWGRWTYVQALTVAASYDDFIQVVPGRFSYAVTHILYGGVLVVAKLFGFRSWIEEYTPVDLRSVATRGNSKAE